MIPFAHRRLRGVGAERRGVARPAAPHRAVCLSLFHLSGAWTARGHVAVLYEAYPCSDVRRAHTERAAVGCPKTQLARRYGRPRRAYVLFAWAA